MPAAGPTRAAAGPLRGVAGTSLGSGIRAAALPHPSAACGAARGSALYIHRQRPPLSRFGEIGDSPRKDAPDHRAEPILGIEMPAYGIDAIPKVACAVVISGRKPCRRGRAQSISYIGLNHDVGSGLALKDVDL